MQKPVTIGDKEFLFVEVPGGASHFTILPNGDLRYFTQKWHDVKLPGSYTILAKGNEATEEQAQDIVPYQDAREGDPFWRNYANEKPPYYDLDTALESLHSKIRAENMLPETTIILLKNK